MRSTGLEEEVLGDTESLQIKDFYAEDPSLRKEAKYLCRLFIFAYFERKA